MNFEPGTILKRPLGGLAGWFYHHMGVYVGDNTVIHFNGEKQKSRNAVLRRDTLEGFAAGRVVAMHAAPRNTDHGQAICAEAERLYQEARHLYNDRYDWVHNNCESFCVNCFEVRYQLAVEE